MNACNFLGLSSGMSCELSCSPETDWGGPARLARGRSWPRLTAVVAPFVPRWDSFVGAAPGRVAKGVDGCAERPPSGVPSAGEACEEYRLPVAAEDPASGRGRCAPSSTSKRLVLRGVGESAPPQPPASNARATSPTRVVCEALREKTTVIMATPMTRDKGRRNFPVASRRSF